MDLGRREWSVDTSWIGWEFSQQPVLHRLTWFVSVSSLYLGLQSSHFGSVDVIHRVHPLVWLSVERSCILLGALVWRPLRLGEVIVIGIFLILAYKVHEILLLGGPQSAHRVVRSEASGSRKAEWHWLLPIACWCHWILRCNWSVSAYILGWGFQVLGVPQPCLWGMVPLWNHFCL